MLGDHVSSDLQLPDVARSLPFQTPWGAPHFQEGLQTPSSDPRLLKRQQLPLLALRNEAAILTAIRAELATIQTPVVDDLLHPADARISESIGQILWAPDHAGAFLNSSPFVLNFLIVWKTILLPAFAILMPLLALVIPFLLLVFLTPDSAPTLPEYLEKARDLILQQISVPAVLRSRGPGDRVGFAMESAFIALTAAMFASGIWNQVTAALHLRTIWSDLNTRGGHLLTLRDAAARILNQLQSLRTKKRLAIRSLVREGEAALAASAALEGLDEVATFGHVWNGAESLRGLKRWVSRVDVLVTLAGLPGICFPTLSSTVGLAMTGVHHPLVKGCVANDFSTAERAHTILTGPNRGGKSTYCKSVGLAVITAQTWGFAWAAAMTWSPFGAIQTALEPRGKLGSVSTFEAEIEFAKSVLDQARSSERKGPLFVMMDEIFHSTNAGDGVAASRVFLEQLYQASGIVSMISTHYKDLSEVFNGSAMPLQVVASEQKDGTLSYTYSVAPGASSISSVMELLREHGLALPPASVASAPADSTQK